MQHSTEVLKIRTLLCFLNKEAKDCSVTKIARTLGTEKYSISRVLISLEEEGLVDRENRRKPVLTSYGRQEAQRYAERMQIAVNHMLYEGVDMNSAKADAFYWALYNSEKTMEVLQTADIKAHVKYAMSETRMFGGEAFCRKFPDGTYSFPFLIYRTKIEQGSNLSWANSGFENSCLLTVKDGIGTIQLRTKAAYAKNPMTGEEEGGYLRSMKYFDLGEYVCAEQSGTLVSFPASVLKFITIGSGADCILHGSVCVKLGSVVGEREMREYDAVFTILI